MVQNNGGCGMNELKRFADRVHDRAMVEGPDSEMWAWWFDLLAIIKELE